jgi:hypothetical protein
MLSTGLCKRFDIALIGESLLFGDPTNDAISTTGLLEAASDPLASKEPLERITPIKSMFNDMARSSARLYKKGKD